MKITGTHAHAVSGRVYTWTADYMVAMVGCYEAEVVLQATIRMHPYEWRVRREIAHERGRIVVDAPMLVVRLVEGAIDRIDEEVWALAAQDL